MKSVVCSTLTYLAMASASLGQAPVSPPLTPIPTTPASPTAPVPSSEAEGTQAAIAEGGAGELIADLPFDNFPPGRFFFDADYIYWWLQGDNLPALATTGPLGSPQSQAGVIGAPGTQTLYGGRDNQGYSGGRFTTGISFNDQRIGIAEFGFLGLGGSIGGLNVPGDNTNILARPFFNTFTGLNDAQLIAYPGLRQGGLSIFGDQSAYGVESNVRPNLIKTRRWKVDAVVGFRWFQFEDNLRINESLLTTTTSSNGVPGGTSLAIREHFDAQNDFWGGQLGLVAEWARGIFFLRLQGKCALGVSYQQYQVGATTSITAPNGSVFNSIGGILANTTNIGSDSQNSMFGVLPEFGVNVGVRLASRARLHAGYSFLYLSQVVRPSNLINTNYDPDLAPPSDIPGGARRPSQSFGTSEVWLQGLNVGLELFW